MAFFSRNDGSFSVDPPILAYTGAEYNVATRHVTIADTHIGLNSEAKFGVAAGLFVAKVGNDYRFLPRAKVTTTAVTTSDTTVKLSPYNVFVPGDVLYTVEPYVILTITASSATQTQTITVEGITATATASSSTVATTATEVAAAINNTAGIKDRVYAIASAGLVYIYAKDGKTLYGVTEGGTVTATLSAATMSYNTTAIGTIQSIAYATGIATLTAAASAAVPIGANLGVIIDELIGLDIHSHDYSVIKRRDISLYNHSVAVRTQFLPYFDHDIARRLPQLIFNTKF